MDICIPYMHFVGIYKAVSNTYNPKSTHPAQLNGNQFRLLFFSNST